MHNAYYYFHVRGAKYCEQCYLWPCLGPPVMEVWYITYFHFCRWPRVPCNGGNRPESKTTNICFVHFARWRHQLDVRHCLVEITRRQYWAKSAVFDCILFCVTTRNGAQLNGLREMKLVDVFLCCESLLQCRFSV